MEEQRGLNLVKLLVVHKTGNDQILCYHLNRMSHMNSGLIIQLWDRSDSLSDGRTNESGLLQD